MDRIHSIEVRTARGIRVAPRGPRGALGGPEGDLDCLGIRDPGSDTLESEPTMWLKQRDISFTLPPGVSTSFQAKSI